MNFLNFPEKLRLRIACFSFFVIGAVFLTCFGLSNSAANRLNSTASSQNSAKLFSANAGSLKFSGTNNKKNNCQNAVPSSMDVTFNVSGLKGSVDTVELKNLTFDPNFKWGAGLTATLISPNGAASQTLFGNQNANFKICNAVTTLNGPYNFADSNIQNAENPKYVLAANSKTANVISLNSAFRTVSDPNGTWILRLTDNAGNALGTVQNASLAITTNEAAPAITHQNIDFNGDGKTDYVVIRPDGGSNYSIGGNSRIKEFYSAKRSKNSRIANYSSFVSGATSEGNDVSWYSSTNGSNIVSKAVNGDSTLDILAPADYDGDGKTDVSVWRPESSTNATFYILQSSNNTLRTDNFGNSSDDPSIVADYDGDGKADVAVYRCPGNAGPCSFMYRGSKNNPNNATTVVPWGYGTLSDLVAYPGDFDGDGKADFCIQREHPLSGSNPQYAGLGQFVLLRSSDFKYEFINWGLYLDNLVPGDYDGDGKTDFGLVRIEDLPTDPRVEYSFYILTRAGGGTGASPIRFGDEGDFVVPGDYDGDGKTDIAVWRADPTDPSDPTPHQSKFYVYKSSDKGLIVFPWGLDGDVPVATWLIN